MFGSKRIRTIALIFVIALVAIWASKRFGFLSSVTGA